MSIEATPAPATLEVPAVTQEAIERETERLIRVAAERNGISPDVLREQVKEEAIAQAKANLAKSAADTSNPYIALYAAERQQRETAENTLQAVRDQGTKSSAPTGDKPHIVVERAKFRVGAHAWNQKLTSDQKLAAVGIPPASVSVKEAAKVFGRGADQKLGIDLMKSDPQRYRTLKLAAMATGVYGG
jgi:hypothetical protein